ncbi:MAG: phage tail protein [Peptococcaceae bacterium]|jgi:TP901-1 family phage major tail protein|nr:MAG: phage tail protein [Peptococcaceae bacterium]
MPAVTGINFLLKVNTGTEGAPVWTTVGGQRDGTLSLDSDGIDVTSKDNMGWADEIVGNNSWSMDFESLLLEDDAAFLELEDAYMSRSLVQVRFSTPAGKTYTGKARVTLEISGPHDDMLTLSGTLTGAGALVKA